MINGGIQERTRIIYEERKYTTDLHILALGLCEEAGEVAAAVLDLSPQYKAKPERKKSDLEHELKDCITYICAIANSMGIDLEI